MNEEIMKMEETRLSGKLNETVEWINKRVMMENFMLKGELPKVSVHLAVYGVHGDEVRVSNGYQQTLDGGGYAAFDVTVNPVAFAKYGDSAPQVIGNKAIELYRKYVD